MFSFLSLSIVSTHTESEHTNSVYYTNKLAVVNSEVTYHTPITITGDTELATMSASGDGSATNPYMIENLVINNCSTSGIGVSIHNTDKYFVLSDIIVANCSTGFFFSQVTYGSIINSYAINNTEGGFELDSSSNNVLVHNTAFRNVWGFGLLSNANNNTLRDNTAINNTYTGFSISDIPSSYNIMKSSNNTLINNTATGSYEFGFELYWRIYNTVLINNTATNIGIFGFEIAVSNNTLLINNKAINNGFGFYLGNAHNNIFKNNVGLYNQVTDYIDHGSSNNTLINNTFIFMNTGLAGSLTIPIVSIENIIVVIILIGIFSAIVYVHYKAKKKNINMEQQSIEQHANTNNRNQSFGVALYPILGAIDLLVVILCTLPNSPYMTVTHIISVTYSESISVNENIFQLSLLSALLLLGGAIITLVGVFIYIHAKSFNDCKIAERASLIGLITQIMGFALMLLAYYNINNDLNVIKDSGLYHYTTNPNIGLLLGLLGMFFAIIAYFSQRIDNKEFLQNNFKSNKTVNFETTRQ